MSTVVKDLGAVSAYAYAVEKGYTGTEAEFAELMADYAEVGQRAEDAADSALESKTAAQTAATTATNKASEATTAAQTATSKAAEAQADADAAALDASQALSAASTATTKATEATTAAATATSAATTATTAKDDAVSAKTAAQTAQTGAETAAASVQSSAAQIATNAEDIGQLKSELSSVDDRTNLNFTKGATWGQGAWIRGNNWETGELNGNLTRVGTTIDIGYNNIVSVQLQVTDNSYSIEYYAFDSQHNSVGYNTTWQKNHNLFFAKGVRYIRIDMRKDDNSNVDTEISKYLIVNVNNSNDIKDVLFRKNDNIRLHILSHNAGAYNYGNSGGYSGDDVDEKVMEWKEMFNHYGADIVFLQENAAYFDSSHTVIAATTLLEPIYPFKIYEGNQALYIASKIPILNPETFDLSVEIDGTNYPRWARKGEITIGGVTICIVDAHFTPGTGAVYDEVREQQWTKLNTLLSDYKLIIIGGDFNTNSSELISSIKNSGFIPVNCAYLGDIPTIGEQATDNILLKGFIPCKTECLSEYACTSDHYPLNSVVRLNTNSLY